MANNIDVEPSGAGARVAVATSEEAGTHYPQYILMGRNPDGDLEEIKSFKGALSSFDSDVNETLVNEHLRMDEGTTDTLGVAAAIGDYDITAVDGTKFLVNDRIVLSEGNNQETATIKITAVTVNVLTMDKPLEHDYTTAATIKTVIKSLNVNGSIIRQTFSISPPSNEIWHIYRLTISMVHSSVPSDDKFADLTKLPNGLLLRHEDGVKNNLTIWRDNGDILEDTGVDLRYSAKSGGGLYGTAARWTFKRSGTVLELNGSTGDRLIAVVQDDLTGLADMEIKVQGHVEGV